MPQPGTQLAPVGATAGAGANPRAWLRAVARLGASLAGSWAGIALIWFVPDLGFGGWVLAAVSLYQLAKAAFAAVHEATRTSQKIVSALLLIVAALHVLVGTAVLSVGAVAALLAGRGARLREGLEWFQPGPGAGE
ncbi:MAG TPA: hypothetical protein VGK67_07965 [Myxococcales bacterium]